MILNQHVADQSLLNSSSPYRSIKLTRHIGKALFVPLASIKCFFMFVDLVSHGMSVKIIHRITIRYASPRC
jgi:hypothetical protein